MNLEKTLAQHKAAILQAWFDQVVETYPSDTAKMLKRRKDPFANPVGSTTRKGLEGLLEELTGRMEPQNIISHLDPIIRIRSVQSFSASQATGFVFLLKAVIRRRLQDKAPQCLHGEAMTALEDRIDRMALAAFDIFMQCREKIYALKAEDQRRQTAAALRRANLITEVGDKVPDPKNNNT